MVAATSAVLSGLWLVESNFARIAGLATDIGRVLASYRPQPRLVEVARTALVLCTMSAFLIQGQQPPRLYLALREFPTAPPDTVIRAAQLVFAAVSEDIGSLFALCDSQEPLVAGMANAVASYAFESENDIEAALAAARRMAEVFDAQPSSNMRLVAHARIGELSLQADPGEPALIHLGIAMAAMEKLGAWTTLARGRWAIVLANLQRGDLAETERMLGEALLLGEDQSVGLRMFDPPCAPRSVSSVVTLTRSARMARGGRRSARKAGERSTGQVWLAAGDPVGVRCRACPARQTRRGRRPRRRPAQVRDRDDQRSRTSAPPRSQPAARLCSPSP